VDLGAVPGDWDRFKCGNAVQLSQADVMVTISPAGAAGMRRCIRVHLLDG
jgi:hypothetical protein